MDTFPVFHPTADRHAAPESKRSFSRPPEPQGNIWHKLWHWWSSLTGPRRDAFAIDIFAQERLRRARLVSALLILVILVIPLLLAGVYPTSFSLLIPAFILTVGSILVIVFNRANFTTLSAVFYVLLVDAALAGFFCFKPLPAINSTNLTTFDLFILAVLVGGVILPKSLIPLNGMLQVAIICAIFFLRPHDPTLTSLIDFAGSVYVVLMPTFVLHLVGTAVAWLHAWSVERALIRANLAEELAEARAELSRQAMTTAKQNQRLEEGINSILDTHRQIAAGNLAARAPVQEDHELWQIGQSLNLLLMRIQQQAQEYRHLQLSQKEVEQIINIILMSRSRSGMRPMFPNFRTSLAQRLLIALKG